MKTSIHLNSTSFAFEENTEESKYIFMESSCPIELESTMPKEMYLEFYFPFQINSIEKVINIPVAGIMIYVK